VHGTGSGERNWRCAELVDPRQRVFDGIGGVDKLEAQMRDLTPAQVPNSNDPRTWFRTRSLGKLIARRLLLGTYRHAPFPPLRRTDRLQNVRRG
jgi:hypothetical protein